MEIFNSIFVSVNYLFLSTPLIRIVSFVCVSLAIRTRRTRRERKRDTAQSMQSPLKDANISVKYGNKIILSLNLDERDEMSIMELKDLLEQETEILSMEQRLVYAGKVLKDEDVINVTSKDYVYIYNQSTFIDTKGTIYLTKKPSSSSSSADNASLEATNASKKVLSASASLSSSNTTTDPSAQMGNNPIISSQIKLMQSVTLFSLITITTITISSSVVFIL